MWTMPSPPAMTSVVDAVGDALAGEVEGLVGVASGQAPRRQPGLLNRGSAASRAFAPRPLPDVGLVSSAISPRVPVTGEQ